MAFEEKYVELINQQNQIIEELRSEIEAQKPNHLGIQDPKNKKFIIYGGGSHAREMHYNLLDQKVNPDNIQIFDNNPENSWCKTKAGLEVSNVREINYPNAIANGIKIILAIGNPEIRAKIYKEIEHSQGIEPDRFANIVHKTAIIPFDCQIGDGAMILQGTSIGTKAKIGKNFFGNTCSIVGHDNLIGDNVSLYTRATLAGHVEVGDRALIAMGANIINGKKIGKDVVVGMGANVTERTKIRLTGEELKDIPDGAIAFKNPAEIVGFKYTRPEVQKIQDLILANREIGSRSDTRDSKNEYELGTILVEIKKIRNSKDKTTSYQLDDLLSKWKCKI